ASAVRAPAHPVSSRRQEVTSLDENRSQQRSPQGTPEGTIWVSETLRNGATAGAGAAPEKEKEEKVSVFWRVFGGTILSLVALAVVTLYNQTSSSIHDVRTELGYLNKDLRKDMTRLSEGHADLVKKDEFSTRMRSVWDNMKELRSDNTVVTALKERTAALEQQIRAADEDRKELVRELQKLREARGADEERKELVRELQRLRERLALVEGKQPAGAPVKPAVHKDQ